MRDAAAGQHDRGWQIIEMVGVGMLTTQLAGGLRARPVEPRPDRPAGFYLDRSEI